MNKRKLPLFLILLMIFGVSLYPNGAPAEDNYAVTGSILDSAESFFISLKDRNYGSAWDRLSSESRQIIIDNVYKSSKKVGEPLEKDLIKKDFREKGAIFNSYWDAFMVEFDPEMVLKNSRWKMGRISENKAEIMIQHKKSEYPAVIRMFRENSEWKVGFLESISGRMF